MKIPSIVHVAVAYIAMTYVLALLPASLRPEHTVYGQTTGYVPCTACPFMSSMTPAYVTAGTSQQATIHGLNLNVSSVSVSISGEDANAVVSGQVSSAAANATITAAANASLGARLVTLSNSVGSLSPFCCLLVQSSVPGPALNAIAPNTASAGAPATNIVLTGSGFDPSSVVRINGSDVTTTFVNSSQLTAQIPASMLSAEALLGVTVINSGAATSDFRVFTVLATDAPVVLGLVPRGLGPDGTASGFLMGNHLLGSYSAVVSAPAVSISIGSGGTITHVPISITVAPNAALGALAANVATPAGTSASGNNFVVAGAGRWTLTEPMQIARSGHTATLLPSGKVLVAGTDLRAEIYDPAVRTWTLTPSMLARRSAHTATLLNNGKILVTGGADSSQQPPALGSCELYDPSSGMWIPTGSLNQVRFGHTATLLNDGRVLVAGGFVQSIFGNPVGHAEIYDPSTESWTLTTDMNVPRAWQTSILLPNGMVLVSGGAQANLSYLSSAELYNPATGGWTTIQPMNGARGSHTASLLPGGRVLVIGGNSAQGPLMSAEIYNSISGNWNLTTSMTAGRGGHTATQLPDGKILVVGSNVLGASYTIANAELYDPENATWTLLIPAYMTTSSHTATLLQNGQVLVAGGSALGPITSVSVLFDLARKGRNQLTSD